MFILPFTALLEVIGYLFRIVANNDAPATGPYVGAVLCILLAPVFLGISFVFHCFYGRGTQLAPLHAKPVRL